MHLSEFKKKFEEEFEKAVHDFSHTGVSIDLTEQTEPQKFKGHWHIYYEINYVPDSEAYFDSSSFEEDLTPALEKLFKRLHMKILGDNGMDYDCELEIRIPRSVLDDRRCFNCGGISKAIFCSNRCRINTKRRRDYRKNKAR